MLTSTGLYISGSCTETGRFTTGVSETGEYAPTYSGLSLQGGFVFGGSLNQTTQRSVSLSGGVVAGGETSFNALYGIATDGGVVAGGSLNLVNGYKLLSAMAVAVGGQLCDVPVMQGALSFGGSLNIATLLSMQTTGGAVSGGRFMYELIGDNWLDQTANTATFAFSNTTASFNMTEV